MPDSNVQSVTPMIAPLRDKVEEQSVALNHNVDKTNDNIRRLGRIVLDMERLDASMKVMRADIRKDLRARRRYFREEQKLIKKDIKQTEKLGNSFIGFRATLAGLAALSAGREFGQGDIMGGLQDSAIAVTAMLPEITSTVLGAVGLALGLKGGGGRGPTAGPRAAAPRGGMRGGMRGGPGFMALLPLALLGSSMLMGSPEKGDQTRVEMIQQQAVEDSLISPKEVNFFSVTVARFGGILDKLLGRKVKDPKVNVNDTDEKPKKPAPPEPPPPPPKVDPVDSMLPGANRTPLDDSKKEALIQLVREGEGTADAQGYNKWFGGDTSLDITKMTGNEVMQEQLRRLKAGETPKFTDAFGVTSTSAAVGAGQFMRPEQVMIDMGLDPATTKMTPEVQDAMILHLAMNTRDVDPSDGIDMAEMERLGKEWASLTSYHGQKDITPQESIDRYNTILEGIRKRKGETKTDPLGPQSSLPMPSIQPSTPAPQIAAVAPEPPSPASITIDPNSAGTTGSEIASTALLSQYNIPAMFS